MSQSAKRSGALLVLGGAVVIAAAVIAFLALSRDQAAIAPPSPKPIPIAQPEPFDVKLRGVGVQEMGNGGIFRRRPGNSRRGAGKHARAALGELTRYLDAALVDPTTRFTDRPVDRLLTARAERELNPKGRRALGVGASPIVGGRTGKASARALVLYDGKRAHAITITYRARVNVLVAGATSRQPLRQSGVMVFVPTKAGWRAEMVEVATDLPQRMPLDDEAPSTPTAPPGTPTDPPATATTPPATPTPDAS